MPPMMPRTINPEPLPTPPGNLADGAQEGLHARFREADSLDDAWQLATAAAITQDGPTAETALDRVDIDQRADVLRRADTEAMNDPASFGHHVLAAAAADDTPVAPASDHQGDRLEHLTIP